MEFGKHALYSLVADPGGYGIFFLSKNMPVLHHVDF
jgi:hypothetical protein